MGVKEGRIKTPFQPKLTSLLASHSLFFHWRSAQRAFVFCLLCSLAVPIDVRKENLPLDTFRLINLFLYTVQQVISSLFLSRNLSPFTFIPRLHTNHPPYLFSMTQRNPYRYSPFSSLTPFLQNCFLFIHARKCRSVKMLSPESLCSIDKGRKRFFFLTTQTCIQFPIKPIVRDF